MRPGFPPHHPSDPELVAGVRLQPALARRIWALARPYGATLSLFLGVIVLGAVIALVPPLLIRRIIDDAIPNDDGGLVTTSALAHGRRWRSAPPCWRSSSGGRRRGSARASSSTSAVKLFDHVQRMPIAFFTRTQTGALTSAE